MNRIAERASALGLPVTASALAAAKIDPDVAPREPRLVEPAAGDLKRLLGQMARRGADPALVCALWARLDGRPLERALVATDALSQAIWPAGEPLLAELRAAADSLGPARSPDGSLGIDLNAHEAQLLIDRHARRPALASATTVELFAKAFDQDLGALDELRRRDDDLLARQATRDSIRLFARLAALARLPTLASVYFDWLVRGLGWRVPALDLCETLFDAGAAHKLPGDAIQPGDVPEPMQQDLAEYCLYRAQLSACDGDTANALLIDHLAQRPRSDRQLLPYLEVVHAHLGTLYGHGNATLARVEDICVREPLWRYAAAVRTLLAATTAPARALELFHTYVSGFGNDFDSALTVLSLVPENVKRDVARIVCREAYYLPHEPAPWKLLGVLFGAGPQVAEEIDARLHRQSA